jgi:hypothetical protein
VKRGLAILLAFAAACGPPATVKPGAPQPLRDPHVITLDGSPKVRRRMVPPEAFLRAYLMWFGGLAPAVVEKRARGENLFDTWLDYLGALGLPNDQLDSPRASNPNAVMLAAIGRLAEALCVRTVEHDRNARLEDRLVFAFEPGPMTTLSEFASRFDVLHRTFLGYPEKLAPGRASRFFAMYRTIAARHGTGEKLTADELGWVGVCTALVQHPETGLY